MIDTHCHLNRPELAPEREAILARAAAAGVRGLVNVGYDVQSSRESLALAEGDPAILATVGVHPHDAALIADADGALTAAGREVLAELRDLASSDRVVAIGEIGLDYYRDLSPRPAQATALRVQLELAAAVDLPAVFHIRDAYDEMLALLDEVGLPPRRAVLHSFAGQERHARWALERGCVLGIGGPVTYKKSHLPRVLTAAAVTADDVLLETDSPWLPPVPYRGKRNEPSYLPHTCEKLADVLGGTLEKLAEATTANVRRVLGRVPGA
jgi:TatD DNase family protein